MSKSRTDTPEGLRALLTREHRELDQLFEALLEALQADARQEVLQLWTAFDDGLCRHLALEEKELLPLLHQHNPREVEALLAEHDQIRTNLAELGMGVDLHEIRVQTVSDFIEQLRRHAKREDALAYRWGEENLPAAASDAIKEGVAAARSQRGGLTESGRKAKTGGARTH
jgi:hemerythrin-like domain-containing protein